MPPAPIAGLMITGDWKSAGGAGEAGLSNADKFDITAIQGVSSRESKTPMMWLIRLPHRNKHCGPPDCFRKDGAVLT